MLPLYSNTSSNIRSNPRVHKWTKKWDKYFRTMRHQATISTLIIVLLFIILITFTIFHYLFIFLSYTSASSSSSSPPFVSPSIPDPAEDIKKGEVNINIVGGEKENKDVKQLQVEEQIDEENNFRREKIKEAFVHSYGGYIRHAFGSDELRPGITTKKI